MVDLLIRDANNYDRSDTRFPYLRDFDIYAGHDWASGHGAFASGNNQESSSEGMNFANALIQWGQVTGNTAVRDAGIFIYTTQAAAIQQYWFDVDGTTFPAGWNHTAVGMVWGDGGSYATWFSAEPEKIQGINMLPITGGHLYLGYRPEYVKKNYQEIATSRAGHRGVAGHHLGVPGHRRPGCRAEPTIGRTTRSWRRRVRSGRTPSTGSGIWPRSVWSTPRSRPTTRWPCLREERGTHLRGGQCQCTAADGHVLHRHHTDGAAPGRRCRRRADLVRRRWAGRRRR